LVTAQYSEPSHERMEVVETAEPDVCGRGGDTPSTGGERGAGERFLPPSLDPGLRESCDGE